MKPLASKPLVPQAEKGPEYYKMLANVQQSMTRLHIQLWAKAHKRLFRMSTCVRYRLFCKNTVQVNALILKDMHCKPLRQCLQDVLKAQRDLKKFEKKIHESFRKSCESDDKFWELKREQHEKAAAEENSASST